MYVKIILAIAVSALFCEQAKCQEQKYFVTNIAGNDMIIGPNGFMQPYNPQLYRILTRHRREASPQNWDNSRNVYPYNPHTNRNMYRQDPDCYRYLDTFPSNVPGSFSPNSNKIVRSASSGGYYEQIPRAVQRPNGARRGGVRNSGSISDSFPLW